MAELDQALKTSPLPPKGSIQWNNEDPTREQLAGSEKQLEVIFSLSTSLIYSAGNLNSIPQAKTHCGLLSSWVLAFPVIITKLNANESPQNPPVIQNLHRGFCLHAKGKYQQCFCESLLIKLLLKESSLIEMIDRYIFTMFEFGKHGFFSIYWCTLPN